MTSFFFLKIWPPPLKIYPTRVVLNHSFAIPDRSLGIADKKGLKERFRIAPEHFKKCEKRTNFKCLFLSDYWLKIDVRHVIWKLTFCIFQKLWYFLFVLNSLRFVVQLRTTQNFTQIKSVLPQIQQNYVDFEVEKSWNSNFWKISTLGFQMPFQPLNFD